MNVPFSLLLAAERDIHPGTVAVGKEVYPDIARKSVGQIAASARGETSRVRDSGVRHGQPEDCQYARGEERGPI